MKFSKELEAKLAIMPAFALGAALD